MSTLTNGLRASIQPVAQGEETETSDTERSDEESGATSGEEEEETTTTGEKDVDLTLVRSTGAMGADDATEASNPTSLSEITAIDVTVGNGSLATFAKRAIPTDLPSGDKERTSMPLDGPVTEGTEAELSDQATDASDNEDPVLHVVNEDGEGEVKQKDSADQSQSSNNVPLSRAALTTGPPPYLPVTHTGKSPTLSVEEITDQTEAAKQDLESEDEEADMSEPQLLAKRIEDVKVAVIKKVVETTADVLVEGLVEGSKTVSRAVSRQAVSAPDRQKDRRRRSISAEGLDGEPSRRTDGPYYREGADGDSEHDKPRRGGRRDLNVSSADGMMTDPKRQADTATYSRDTAPTAPRYLYDLAQNRDAEYGESATERRRRPYVLNSIETTRGVSSRGDRRLDELADAPRATGIKPSFEDTYKIEVEYEPSDHFNQQQLPPKSHRKKGKKHHRGDKKKKRDYDVVEVTTEPEPSKRKSSGGRRPRSIFVQASSKAPDHARKLKEGSHRGNGHTKSRQERKSTKAENERGGDTTVYVYDLSKRKSTSRPREATEFQATATDGALGAARSSAYPDQPKIDHRTEKRKGKRRADDAQRDRSKARSLRSTTTRPKQQQGESKARSTHERSKHRHRLPVSTGVTDYGLHIPSIVESTTSRTGCTWSILRNFLNLTRKSTNERRSAPVLSSRPRTRRRREATSPRGRKRESRTSARTESKSEAPSPGIEAWIEEMAKNQDEIQNIQDGKDEAAVDGDDELDPVTEHEMPDGILVKYNNGEPGLAEGETKCGHGRRRKRRRKPHHMRDATATMSTERRSTIPTDTNTSHRGWNLFTTVAKKLILIPDRPDESHCQSSHGREYERRDLSRGPKERYGGRRTAQRSVRSRSVRSRSKRKSRGEQTEATERTDDGRSRDGRGRRKGR